MKVFIADDSEEACNRLARLLGMIDGVFIEGKAHNIMDAISSVHRLKPDVLLLDIRMQDGSGLEVLKAVKLLSPPPIVMMMTNQPIVQYRTKYIAEGADYFFDKATDLNKVFAICSGLNASRKYHFPN